MVFAPMTYQVLARKWRPRRFADLVGQEHVVRALVNALERGQLHHAYLFTGTRGVGKTTLARILAKTLNCEQGVGPNPCGVCSACREIDEGRFLDLIEVDAASRTKVDQTRELLDNVPFAPVHGRLKLYLIDEAHMFSSSSFNALLKTLEEPPDHVKFVLATTDPQKLPATVLSRCLQFNLKRLLPDQIAARLRQVLEAETIDFDAAALALLARAADGSMRDGLSLLDQAIAFGGGRVGGDDVRLMLGTRCGDLGLDLLDALADGDGARVLSEVERMAALTPDFDGVLKDLIDLLHRLALAQQVPHTLASDDPDHDRLAALALRMQSEDVQLFYQVLLTGQKDLPLAPNPRTGLEMVLLRALAFRPAPSLDENPASLASRKAGANTKGRYRPDNATGQPTTQVACVEQSKLSAEIKPKPDISHPADKSAATSQIATGSHRMPESTNTTTDHPVSEPATATTETSAGTSRTKSMAAPPATSDDWHQLVATLDLTGLSRQLAEHCAFIGWNGKHLRLALDPSAGYLRSASAEQRLSAGLSAAMGHRVDLSIDSTSPTTETPALRQARNQAEIQAEVETAMRGDPVANELQRRFDAEWLPNSIRPTAMRGNE